MCVCEDNDDKSSSSEHHLKMTSIALIVQMDILQLFSDFSI